MKKYKLVKLNVDSDKELGCPTALEFDLGVVKDEKQADVHLKGHILCQQPFGSYPSIDKENISRIEQESTKWAEDIQLIKPGDRYYEKFCKSKFANLTAHFIPNMKLKDTKAYLYITMFIFAFDDVLDNRIQDLPEYKNLDYPKLILIVQSFVDILAGKYKDLKDLPRLKFPFYEPLCKSLFAVHQLIANYKNISYFIQGFDNYLKAVVWEFTEHDDITSSQETYMFRRRHTIAFPSTLELVFLLQHTELSKEQRGNLLIKRFLESTFNITALSNDIFSLSKEIANHELENLVIIKQKELGLKKAFKYVLNFLNSEIREEIRLGHKLKKTFPGDKHVHQFVNAVQNYLDGQLYWYGDSVRYGDPHLKMKKVEWV